jgi:Spy/CpxP family protein refolding chaperone
MKRLGIVLAGLMLVLPSLAAGQALPFSPAPGDGDPAASALFAQVSRGFPPGVAGERRPDDPGSRPPMGPPPRQMMGPGAWWKDSEMVRRLNLSEAQLGQIEKTFLAHRLRLVDLHADLEKAEIGLQPLLDAERPEESKVSAQLDSITTARGRLEKEHALMLLAIRQVLTTDQWKQLQAQQRERAKGRYAGPPSGPGAVPGRPAPAPFPR